MSESANINIGGGDFSHPGWLNLDGRQGFRFTPDCTIPAEDRSAAIVYSSHCLEHLDDATVDRVLSEARRVCAGRLVLKLPDFEEVLRRWRERDPSFFSSGWGFDRIAHTWPSRNLEDSIDTRAAMIFCGFWNAAYGDEWGNQRPDAEGAFHGPVGAMTEEIASLSPHEISARFKSRAPAWAIFNHQNAWSRHELAALLTRHGFAVESLLPQQALGMNIPTISEMQEISLYAIASLQLPVAWEEHLRAFPVLTKGFYRMGRLPRWMVENLRRAVIGAPRILFTNEAREPDLEMAEMYPEAIALLNEYHAYRDLNEPTALALRTILDFIRDQIADALSSPWRVLNVRSWTTKSSALEEGPNAWHTDGDIPAILKLMIYATPTPRWGGMELMVGEQPIRLNGESWVLFQNSLMDHRGIAPNEPGLERVAIEVTLCQAKVFDLRPRFLGLAARHAVAP